MQMVIDYKLRNDGGTDVYNENTYEQEIDLKELMFALLYRWRPILLAALALGVLFGGYKAVDGMRRQGDAALLAESREEYGQDQMVYERDKAAYERDIQILEKFIEDQSVYLEESLLMRLDPYNKPEATADILLRLDGSEWEAYPEEMNMDPTDSLVKLYASNLIQRIDWDGIEELTGLEAVYLKELVSAGTDYGSNTVTVKAFYQDEETAEKILDEVLRQMEGCHDEFASVAGAHTAQLANKSVGTVADIALADRQKANSDKISNYEKSVRDKEKLLNDLEEPESPAEWTNRKVAADAVKYAVVGAIGGVGLVACCFCAWFVFCGKFHNDEELKSQFGFRVLGVFAHPERTGALSSVDRWLERLEGKAARPSEDDVLGRAALGLENCAGGMEKILVTGTVPEDALRRLADGLSEKMEGIQLVVGPDLNQNAETLRLLVQCDGAILVEQREVSRCRMILKEKEAIEALDKKVIGCLVL